MLNKHGGGFVNLYAHPNGVIKHGTVHPTSKDAELAKLEGCIGTYKIKGMNNNEAK